MIEKYYEALQKRENLRENLVELRNRMKDETVRKQFASLTGDGRLLLELLEEEDPKVRKNAAMILGELRLAGAADALVTAYEREQTLFVKSAYLKALAYLDITAYQERLKERMEELLSYTPAIEEKKHIDEEVRALGRLLEKAEDNKSHAFTGFKDQVPYAGSGFRHIKAEPAYPVLHKQHLCFCPARFFVVYPGP